MSLTPAPRAYIPSTPSCFRRARLSADYVIDAHVAQVLTSSHLARAGTLDSYVLEEIAQDRFLAVARDSQPWLAERNPEFEVLQRARIEFGAALLTSEVLAANPRRDRRRPPSRRGAEWGGTLGMRTATTSAEPLRSSATSPATPKTPTLGWAWIC